MAFQNALEKFRTFMQVVKPTEKLGQNTSEEAHSQVSRLHWRQGSQPTPPLWNKQTHHATPCRSRLLAHLLLQVALPYDHRETEKNSGHGPALAHHECPSSSYHLLGALPGLDQWLGWTWRTCVCWSGQLAGTQSGTSANLRTAKDGHVMMQCCHPAWATMASTGQTLGISFQG